MAYVTGASSRTPVRLAATIRIVLAATMVLAMSPVVPSLPLRAQESPDERQDTEALCPDSAESWDILFLMDESQSLRDNDPDRDRIGATKRYLFDLAEIADFGAGIRIRVALAAFGSDFDLRMDFTDLREERAIERMYDVVDGFSADDLNTDYVLALYGSLDLDWSAACNRVVWLTDGQHDLGDAHRGDRSPRPYDGLQRPLTSRSVARAVEDLLIPAVCGVADGTADEVAAGYGDLRGRVEELGVEIEDRLYYVGELVPGDTRTLIDRMSSEDCGRPTVVEPIPEWPRLPMCVGLPDARLPAGRGVVWSGELPDGVAPVFVRSVIVQAAGDSPLLTTGHPFQRLEGDGPVRRLTLDFNEEPWSAFSPAAVAVRGEGVEEACVSAVLEPPSLEVQVVTSPIFPDSPVELVISANGRTLSAADEGFLEVRLDGEAVSPVMAGQGTVQIPEQPVGDHTFEVRLVSDHADPAIATGSFTVSPKPAICKGLPKPQLPAGRDVVWSGKLPDGVAPAFVRSVIVQATGDPVVLSSDHPSRVLEEDDDFRRLTLDFSDEPLSAFSPAEVEVRGEGVDESCLAIVLEPPSIEARIVTSPIFPDTSHIEIEVEVDGNPITAVDSGFMTLLIDGEEYQQPEMTGEGQFEIPISPSVGDHAFEARIESDHADPAIASGAFTVLLKPDGPILRLVDAGLDLVTDTEFTIPITIDDEGRPGEIRLLRTGPIVGTDGSEVRVEVRFPDGRSVWNSSHPEKPPALMVSLGDSVQTPADHVMRLSYESVPSDPDGETRAIPLAVRVGFDHPRNPVLEAIIVAALLLLLLLIIWAWVYGINRLAGRIRRPRRTRYARFRVNEDWTLASDIADASHRRIKYIPSRLEAGQLLARRKVPLRVWQVPYVELSMVGSRQFSGLIGAGFDATEVSNRSEVRLSGNRLHQPIVVVDVSGGTPFNGVVMAPVDPSSPAEDQLTDHVRRVLERLPRPDHE